MKTGKTERKKKCAGLMGAWSHAQYAGEREREKTQKNSIQKLFNLHVCVFNANFYTSPYKD